MTIENEFFEISNIEWRNQKSKEITPDRNPSQPIRVGINSMQVRCKKCCAEWTADRRGNGGKFRQAIGFTHVTCPDCEAESVFPNAVLEKM